MGGVARALDASIGWYEHVLEKERLEALVPAGVSREKAAAFRRHIRSVTAEPPPLRTAKTYDSRLRYSSAIAHLEGALALVSSPFPDFEVRIADLVANGPRQESRHGLLHFARLATPFDQYFIDKLIPDIERAGATCVAISLTFQSQAIPACRLAMLLRERLPKLRRVLGGPLVSCWSSVAGELSGGAFELFDDVLSGTDDDLRRLAGVAPEALAPIEPLSPDLDEPRWDAYMSPIPVIPVALARGCYWRRCAFCPDSLHPGLARCSTDSMERWLESVVARFPRGAMLHLTDSALPPRHIDRLARIIAERRLPLRWHGFVRPERIFADEAFVHRLADGNCDMVQIGVESGSPRLLELMRKGTDLRTLQRIARNFHSAGIRLQIYLLFGLPTETDEDRELSLRFVEELGGETFCDINTALLNLPRGSPMQRTPAEFGITEITPFPGDADLSLYDDFRCGERHPRVEARRWLSRRFMESEAVKAVYSGLRAPFKANHACFLPKNESAARGIRVARSNDVITDAAQRARQAAPLRTQPRSRIPSSFDHSRNR